jgi:hypothetical protein
MDGIISLGYAYNDNDELILNFKYGDTLEDVETKLANINMYFI